MGTPQMRGRHIEAYRLAAIPLGFSAGLPIRQHNSFCWGPRRGIGNPSGLYERYGTRLRAHALSPDNLKIETNRAHALMFMGHDEEAKALYLAHKGKPISEVDELWELAIADDFADFRKAGLTHPMMDDIEKELGISR